MHVQYYWLEKLKYQNCLNNKKTLIYPCKLGDVLQCISQCGRTVDCLAHHHCTISSDIQVSDFVSWNCPVSFRNTAWGLVRKCMFWLILTKITWCSAYSFVFRYSESCQQCSGVCLSYCSASCLARLNKMCAESCWCLCLTADVEVELEVVVTPGAGAGMCLCVHQASQEI